VDPRIVLAVDFTIAVTVLYQHQPSVSSLRKAALHA
jgi:hypothetical protein